MNLLLTGGADPNAKADLMNPLLMAREKGHTEVEEALKGAGAKETLGFIGDLRRKNNQRNLKCNIS